MEKVEQKSYRSWTISDEFWEAVKDDIPKMHRVEGKDINVSQVGGRKLLPERQVLEGIFYVLRTDLSMEHYLPSFSSDKASKGNPY